MADLKILTICGSLRKASTNRMAMNLAAEVAPQDLVFEEAEIRTLPHFDDDEFAKGFPAAAVALRDKIRAADGIFFACPEYNHSLSGVLKNAIDWASRPPDQPFAGKPVTVMSATAGQQGGGRAQYHLRAVMLSLLVYFMPKPETFIGFAPTKFDKEGKCTDATTRKFVTEHMAAFRDWVLKMKKLG
jgi:chromate reductase